MKHNDIKHELRRKYDNAFQRGGVNGFFNFGTFYRWAIAQGFTPGDTLRRKDAKKPFNPENCYFVKSEIQPPFYGAEKDDFIRRWNRAVNPFRRAAGMPPFPDPGEEQLT